MSKQYLFLFTEGWRHDYYIGELCICDHEVTEEEWMEFERKYRTTVREMWSKVPHKTSSFMPYHNVVDTGSQEYKNLEQWKEDNEPMQAFQKLHNMQVIEYTELNGD